MIKTQPISLTDLSIPTKLHFYTITLRYWNRSVLATCTLGSPLPGTGTVLVLVPFTFGSPFPGTGTVLVPTMPVPFILQ